MQNPSQTSGHARTYRIAIYALGLLACALIGDGWVANALGGGVTLLALALYMLEDPKFFRLVLMWCAGFLLIIVPEGLSDATIIKRLYGAASYDIASRCLVASHFAMLLGHDLVFKESDVRPSATPWRLALRFAVPILAITWVLSMLYVLPTAILSYRGGRAAQGAITQASALGAVADGLSLVARVAVPVASIWVAKRVRGPARTLLLGMVAISLATEVLFSTRFVLLFVTVGCLVARTAPRPPTRRMMGALLALALVLVVTSTVLTQTRTFGLRTANVGQVVETASAEQLFTLNEQSVRSMTQAVVYARRRGFTDGRTSAALLVFWVPRALWPSKPKLIGYWLPREFGKIDEGFSSAPGFTGGTYVDFGLWGSVVAWFMIGLVFGGLERMCARVLAGKEDARVLLVAPLFGGVFFAVRSPETATLSLVGVMLATLLFQVLVGRRRLVRAAGTSV